MLYAREVETRRRDVKVVDVNLLRRSWYLDYLRRAYPDLIHRSQEKVDIFAAELKHWDDDPEAYASNVVLTQRIASAFGEMFQSFVRKELEVAPVYVGSEFVLMTEQPERELTQWLVQNYQAFPRGLVFQLAEDRVFHDPGLFRLQTRGLNDGTIKFEKTDVVSMKVLPVYKVMLVNRGRYLAHFNRHERAIAAFKEALAFDPNLDLARQGLSESLQEMRNREWSQP